MTGSEAHRRIGTRGLVVFYVSNLVGAGILIVPGLAARIAGPASLLSWGILIALSFPVALLFAGISARRPNCGGISAMIRAGLGTGPGETASLLLVAAYVLFIPVMGMASASYACDLFGLGPAWTLPIAAVCLLVSVGFCFARVGTTAKLQGAMLVALIAGLAAAIVLAGSSMSPARLQHFAPHGWFSVGAALPIVFLSFIGWDGVSAVAEEVHDPRRSFPRAVRIAVPVVGILYLAVVGAFLAMPHTAGALVMPTLLGAGGGHARTLGDVLALAVVGLCTNSSVLCGSRLVLAAARDGLLPARLSHRSQTTGAPTTALLALGGACVLMIAATAVLRLQETSVVALTTAVFMILYLATAVAALRERSRGTKTSAAVTGVSAVCMLPFTGLGLPIAASLSIVLTIVLALRRHPWWRAAGRVAA